MAKTIKLNNMQLRTYLSWKVDDVEIENQRI